MEDKKKKGKKNAREMTYKRKEKSWEIKRK